MNERMKQDLDRQLAPVEWTAADTHAVRLGMQEKRSPRRKLRAGLVLALLLVLMGTAAVAGTQNGLLGLIQRMQYPDLPNEAQSYIQTDDVTLETDDFLVTIPEHYYDGRTLRTTVTVRPKEGRKLLYTYGVASYEPWQKLIQLDKLNVDPNDTRTLQDMFSAFDKVHCVHLNLLCDGEVLQDRMPVVFFTRDFVFDPETCTLTFFLQARFEEQLPQREMELKMTIYENEDGMLVHHQRLLHSMTLTANTQRVVYECTEPSYYPKAGVRINSLTLEVLPQDIYYTIDFTILDWKGELYNRTKSPAIMFAFYQSIPQEGELAQYLADGLRGITNMRRIDDEHSVETGVLSRSELHDTYYICIRDFVQQKRLGVNALQVHPVDGE